MAGAAAVVVIGLAIVLAIVLLDRSNTVETVEPAVSIPHNSIAAIEPGTGKLLAVRRADLSVGNGLNPSLAGGEGSVWSYGAQAQTLYRMAATAPYALQQIGIGITPTGVATGGGNVWLIDGWDRYLMRISAQDPTAVPPKHRFRWGTTPGATLAATPSALWASLAPDAGSVSLVKLDPATGRVLAHWNVHGGGVAADGPYVWLEQQGGVREIQPNRSQPVTFPWNTFDPPPTYLAAGFGNAWYAFNLNLWKIAPGVPAEPADRIPLPTSPHGIAIGDGRVWVATYSEIDGINPHIDKIVKRIPLATPVSSLAFYDGKLWVART